MQQEISLSKSRWPFWFSLNSVKSMTQIANMSSTFKNSTKVTEKGSIAFSLNMTLSCYDGKCRLNKQLCFRWSFWAAPRTYDMEANLVISKLIMEKSQESQRFRLCSATCIQYDLEQIISSSSAGRYHHLATFISEHQTKQETQKCLVNCLVLHRWKGMMFKCISIPSTFSKDIHNP